MAEVAVDFGTSNTVVARWNETTQQAETLDVPGYSGRLAYRITPDGEEHNVRLTPSVVHYLTKTETLIGEPVVSRGLVDHKETYRFMKRAVAAGSTERRMTAQGWKTAVEAADEFLTSLLVYAQDRISFADDSFTFTAPVEAFENYQDWLLRICDRLGIRRVRLLDEPTAAVFGAHGATKKDDRFLVFDFGGGTLDVAAVRIDMAAGDRKAIQLGHGGRDLGGMDIDRWLADDFALAQGLDRHEARELKPLLLRQAEAAKIALSDPRAEDADMTVLNRLGGSARAMRVTYRRECASCERGRDGGEGSRDERCMGCLLVRKKFLVRVREAVEDALENAAIKAGMRKSELTRVVVTGGTSLVPCVRRYLEAEFDGKVAYSHPFDTVVRGACRGIVEPVLRHDYALESWNAQTGRYEFKPLFKVGDEYPTPPGREVSRAANGAADGQQRVGLKVFEVSRVKAAGVDLGVVDKDGYVRRDSQVQTELQYICLNADNPTFVQVDPPVFRERDKRRFQAMFRVDENRTLLVEFKDHLVGKTLLPWHPLVRL